MKKNRLILIICSCLCVILSGVVMAIAFSYTVPKHEHILGEGKTYHICNNHIYYTRLCQDGCNVAFETKATFSDVLASVTEDDKIVLDENVTLSEEMNVKSFVGTGLEAETLTLNIDIDLNGFTLSNNVVNSTNNSMFMFNANLGKINFSIKNGKITSSSTPYLFRFKNNKQSGSNIVFNIEDVECSTYGIQTTPIYGASTYNMQLNATDCKFVAYTTGTQKGDYGVGAYINSDSEYNFNNCYFEGGDAVYVRSGVVNLTGCKLVNEGLVSHSSQSTDSFSAVGSCLTVDSYTTTKGVSKFVVTISNCIMNSNSSSKMISTIETEETSGLGLSVNQNSLVDVKSCVFYDDPTAFPQADIVKYPNNQAPINNGSQVWTCGDVAEVAAE